MARTKKIAPVEAAVPTDAPIAPEVLAASAPTPKAKRTSVTVTWDGGSREFSKEIHGDGFEALAKEFSDNFNGTIA